MVADARAEIQTQFDAEVAKKANEEANKPFATYTAPDFYGAFTFNYPHLYFIFAQDYRGNQDQLKVFVSPTQPTDVQNQTLYTFFRIVIRNRNFNEVLKDIENNNNARLTGNKMTEEVTTVSGITGRKFRGKLDPSKDPNAVIILLPYRDKTMFIIDDDPTSKLDNGMTREAYFNQFLPTINLHL